MARKERNSIRDSLLRLGEVTLPKETRSAIIVFSQVKDAKPDVTCTVTAVDDSPRKFPGGSLLTVNATGFPAKFRLEKEDYFYQPGDSGIIGNPPEGNGKIFKFWVFFKEHEAWSIRGAGVVPRPGKSRVLVVFRWDDKKSRPSFQMFRDPVAP